MEIEYEVGQTVQIVGNCCFHGFNNGDRITIVDKALNYDERGRGKFIYYGHVRNDIYYGRCYFFHIDCIPNNYDVDV